MSESVDGSDKVCNKTFLIGIIIMKTVRLKKALKLILINFRPSLNDIIGAVSQPPLICMVIRPRD